MKSGSEPLRSVLHSSVWWTIGNSLTTGGFLTYFAAELGIRDRSMGVLLALPELVGGIAFVTRSVDWKFRNRKVTWIVCSILARIFAFGIPLSILLTPSTDKTQQNVWLLFVALALTSVLQAIANVAWISWMSEVFERPTWGRFLALRNIAILVVLITLPVGVGYLRDAIKLHPPWGLQVRDALQYFYLTAFVVGNLVILGSMLPLLTIPSPSSATDQWSRSTWDVFQEIFRTPDFRSVVWFHWWHAFWSGLTQAAFFDYRFHYLHVGLGTYYALEAMMRLVQIPVCAWSGRVCDRGRTRTVLAVGVVCLSISLVFWMVATREEWWWIWGAYLLWGAWGAINVAGPTLSLRYAPAHDNTLHLALAERGAGMWAGVAGLVGGWLLSEWVTAAKISGSSERMAFVSIFAVGMVGRLASLYLLARVHSIEETSDRRSSD